MFKNEQLEHILKSLNYSMNSLENNLSKYEDYLADKEKKEILHQLEAYQDISLKVEWMLENENKEWY